MTTEAEARALLVRAADTIDVPPAPPLDLPVRRRRRWVVPVAAAAAVALIVGGGVLLGHERETVQPTDKPMPVEREHAYGDDEMPAVLGFTEAEARTLLEQRGLVVETRTEPSCLVDGTPLRTLPGPGTSVEPGDRVILSVTDDATFDCVTNLEAEWRFIRFARGLETPLPVADTLRLLLPDGSESTLGPELSADPANWSVCEGVGCDRVRSITGAVARWATAPVAGGRPVDFGSCARSATPTRKRAVTIEPVDPDLPPGACPGQFVELEHDDQGRITSARLADQEPERGDPQEPSALQLPLARHFVKWARGQARPPVFAETVQQLWHDMNFASVGRSAAAEAVSWEREICPMRSVSSCPFNPLAVIANDPRGVEFLRRTAGRSMDGPGGDALPAALAERPQDIIEILPKGAVVEQGDGVVAIQSHYWSVELWINEQGEIYAVNLRRPPR